MNTDDQPEKTTGGAGFDPFGLHPDALTALTALGFEHPTPIQTAAIPPLLAGRDVIAGARTGSGKTAAFGLPLLERVRGADPGLRALVLTPTRELALQVTDALRALSGEHLRVATVYGGASYTPQLRALRDGVPVVVGTPGRLLDLLDRGALDLTGIELLVLDEADEMLRMGFIDAVERIVSETPPTRQVALFSATMPPAIARVAASYLRDPAELRVDGTRGPATDHIEQVAIRAPSRFKIEAVERILRGEDRDATLIFCRTKRGCQELADALTERGLTVAPLHGDMGQRERERVVEALRRRWVEVVVATDVAARGIDVQHITHVINLELPDSPDVYTHRIGRTGRAGRAGKAISLIAPQEDARFRFLKQRLRIDIPAGQLPSDADIARRQQARLRDALDRAAPDTDTARAWVDSLLAEGSHTPEDLAAAAIALLAADRGIPLGLRACEDPPTWSRPPQSSRPNRPPRTTNRPAAPRRTDANDAQVFVSVGRAHGVRPADIVGALTHDQGLSGHVIGRIHISERKAFVGLPTDVSRELLAKSRTIQVRGIEARIAAARPHSAPGPRQRRAASR